MMDIDAATRMATDEFLAWAETRPKGEHHELQDGGIVATASERTAHGLVRSNVAFALSNDIRRKALPRWLHIGTMAVEIGPDTVFEPDVVVRRGTRLPPDALKLTDPLIVAEILSPPDCRRVPDHKRAGYPGLASLRHDLVVDTDRRMVTHHARSGFGWIETSVVDGPVTRDPPGLLLDHIFE